MKNKFIHLLSAGFLLVVLSITCFADGFDGYVVKIKEDTLNSMTSFSLFAEGQLYEEMSDSEVVGFLAEEIEQVSEINNDHGFVKAENESSLETLLELGVVEYYEPDVYMELLGEFDVTDNPAYTANQKWFYDYINVPFAWDAGITGKDVKIGVIDSGVYPHSDIDDNLLEGYNYDTKTPDYGPYDTTDNVSHGTFVAGLIAAECNSSDAVGIAFNSKIVPFKVTHSGSNVNMSLVMDAMYDAVDIYGCDVINISLGTITDADSIKAAVDYCIKKGAIIVSASGNRTASNAGYDYIYPAAYDEVICVSNAMVSGSTLKIKSTSIGNDKVDVAAIGTDVTSLNRSNTGVRTSSGTSFSSPQVAAAAAFAKSLNPDITPAEFAQYITESADGSYVTGEEGQQAKNWGAGLLDVEKLIKLVLADTESSDGYFSDSFTVGDRVYVTVTNLTDKKLTECPVLIKNYDSEGILVSQFATTVSISASGSADIDVTDYETNEYTVYELVVNDYMPGDIDGNGNISNKDASAILRHLAGYTVDLVEEALDVNGDGRVDNRDASAILRYLAGYDVELN